MPRLIDAEHLKKRATDLFGDCWDNYAQTTEDFLEYIDNEPTVDAVEDIIYRQDAIELAMQYCPDDDGTCSKADEDIRNLLDELENLPSAVVDAEPVRHGHWVVDEDGNIKCSECGHYGVGDDYCERCGAKMDGKRKKEI